MYKSSWMGVNCGMPNWTTSWTFSRVHMEENGPLQGGYLLADRSVLGTTNDILHDLLYCISLRVVSTA